MKKNKQIGWWKGKKLSEEHKRKIGLANKIALKGNKVSKETKKKIGIASKGRKHTQESKKKMSILMIGNKRCLGRKHSKKTIKKMSLTHKKYYKTHPGTRGHLGYKHTEETKRKMKITRARQVVPFKDTKIEVKIQDFLKKLNIEFYTHNYINEIKHKYQCDILLPLTKTIIECDGDAFHFNPKKYKATDKIFKKGMTAQQRWDLDAIRTKELQEVGFTVIRLWGSDIEKMTLTQFKGAIKQWH